MPDIAHDPRYPTPEASKSVRGSLAKAALAFGVEHVVVTLPREMSRRILSAQRRQVMVNMSADEAEALA
jgi:hypothetical protein